MAKHGRRITKNCLAILGSLKRFLVDGIFIIFIVLVFVIVPGLLDVLMFVGMVVMSSIRKVRDITGSMMKSLASSPMPWLVLLPMFLMIWAVIN